MCAAQEGTGVTVSITTAQLELIAAACSHYRASLYGCQQMPLQKAADLAAIVDLCCSTVADPGSPGTVHGFAV